MNIQLAKTVLEKLVEAGVSDVILCAGARNSPFVVLLEKAKGLRLWNFFEERTAGFFALGKAQSSGRPVAVITTSGTAVAELVPAAVEATYAQTPLIFVTADRPRSYRGTGAPQSIDQVGIFFRYVETCLDVASLEEELDLRIWSRTSPLQINVCFDEPLIDEAVPSLDLTPIPTGAVGRPVFFSHPQIRPVEQPLVIVGTLSPEQAQQVAPHLEKLGAPIYAESLSNLRSEPHLQHLFLQSGEQIVRELFIKGLCQSVIRIGGVPTLRFWRDLEEVFQKVPVVSLSGSDFTGLSRPVQHVVGWDNLPLLKSQWTKEERPAVFSLDRQKRDQIQGLLLKYPKSEVALLSRLALRADIDFAYVGNSLPIREWDLVCPFGNKKSRQAGNRGANGIDGQVASFLGHAREGENNWAILGDLTTLYDLSSLWISPQLEDSNLRIVVINNRGGQIFKNLFGRDIFLNRHEIEFSSWARMFHWDYQQWSDIPSEIQLPRRTVLELNPDSEQSDLFWREYKR